MESTSNCPCPICTACKAQGEYTEFECPVCYEKCSSNHRFNFMCNHSVCLSCFLKMFFHSRCFSKENPVLSNKLACPVCRDAFSTDGFPTGVDNKTYKELHDHYIAYYNERQALKSLVSHLRHQIVNQEISNDELRILKENNSRTIAALCSENEELRKQLEMGEPVAKRTRSSYKK